MVPEQSRQTSTLLYCRLCLWPVYCFDFFHGSVWICCLIQQLEHMFCGLSRAAGLCHTRWKKAELRNKEKQLWILLKRTRAETTGGPWGIPGGLWVNWLSKIKYKYHITFIYFISIWNIIMIAFYIFSFSASPEHSFLLWKTWTPSFIFWINPLSGSRAMAYLCVRHDISLLINIADECYEWQATGGFGSVW